MQIKNKGVVLGLLFCFISAAFDVYVAFVTQTLSTVVVIFYCFVSSSLLFLGCSLWKDRVSLFSNVKQGRMLVVWINISVVLNWGGLFYALRYLEPAVVGVASVACGPALTMIISAFIKSDSKATPAEAVIACLVLLSVAIMLFQSFVGVSGISSTTFEQRIIGIVSVVLCALGTVLYTVVSKRMFARHWKVEQILAIRNLLMVAICSVLVSVSDVSFSVATEWIAPMLVLVVLGHVLPIYLIQQSIFHLSALHVSFVLLTLPVFTLWLQYMDSRVAFSMSSVVAVGVIVALLLLLSLSSVRKKR
ncbi:EamA family transporter [Pseudomonas sp. CCC3.1]|uniref:EamA family transporter n=1 Tax=Pseudomonas sp. CCC3.1 TaxID=3048607 RepID=UPI002AC992F7|nr:EamA family transporter [Pseudomonas sp. CCC3.1]MEB0205342.1 EamA family transporter [Pseudomonas sp. CCC3.1]WPX34697.1 EamA family transporter [Pseudomonas sp. CCC3.1]